MFDSSIIDEINTNEKLELKIRQKKDANSCRKNITSDKTPPVENYHIDRHKRNGGYFNYYLRKSILVNDKWTTKNLESFGREELMEFVITLIKLAIRFANVLCV